MTLFTRVKVRSKRFLSWLFNRLIQNDGVLDSWIARDTMLMDQWMAAYHDENLSEMERVHELMQSNYAEFKSKWL